MEIKEKRREAWIENEEDMRVEVLKYVLGQGGGSMIQEVFSELLNTMLPRWDEGRKR